MALAEPPAVEYEIVLRHLRQRRVERASRGLRQNDVVEGPARSDRLDGAASGRAEQTCEWNRRHASTVPPLGRTIKPRGSGSVCAGTALHSALRAASGSTHAARRAGMTLAASAI